MEFDMSVNNDPQFFRTSDIWLVGYLLATGERYLDVNRTVKNGRNKVYFLFPPEVEVRAHEFFNGGTLPAVAYRNSVENVKSILFDF